MPNALHHPQSRDILQKCAWLIQFLYIAVSVTIDVVLHERIGIVSVPLQLALS